MRDVFLSDKQWSHIEPLLPNRSSKGRPWADHRLVLEGILWILRTGARWMAASPPLKKGACVGKTKKGKGTKWMVVVDGQGCLVSPDEPSSKQCHRSSPQP